MERERSTWAKQKESVFGLYSNKLQFTKRSLSTTRPTINTDVLLVYHTQVTRSTAYGSLPSHPKNNAYSVIRDDNSRLIKCRILDKSRNVERLLSSPQREEGLRRMCVSTSQTNRKYS
jgi:hypothetical protein